MVDESDENHTTETQRTQRLHREIPEQGLFGQSRADSETHELNITGGPTPELEIPTSEEFQIDILGDGDEACL